MARTTSNRTTSKRLASTARQLLDQIKTSDQVTRQDYLQLTSAILADTSLTHEDRRHINRLFDDIQTGRLHLID